MQTTYIHPQTPFNQIVDSLQEVSSIKYFLEKMKKTLFNSDGYKQTFKGTIYNVQTIASLNIKHLPTSMISHKNELKVEYTDSFFKTFK